MTDLNKIKCIPCNGDTPTLTNERIQEYLKSVNGWTQKESTIEKTFLFNNFKEALAFFNRVAAVAEEEDHHPDMSIHKWKKVTLVFTTHAVHGLTDNDFVMAAKVDHL